MERDLDHLLTNAMTHKERHLATEANIFLRLLLKRNHIHPPDNMGCKWARIHERGDWCEVQLAGPPVRRASHHIDVI